MNLLARSWGEAIEAYRRMLVDFSGTCGPGTKQKKAYHARRMMVICSPLSDFLALWSSYSQSSENRPHGDDPDDPDYQKSLFSVARGSFLGHALKLMCRHGFKTNAAPSKTNNHHGVSVRWSLCGTNDGRCYANHGGRRVAVLCLQPIIPRVLEKPLRQLSLLRSLLRSDFGSL